MGNYCALLHIFFGGEGGGRNLIKMGLRGTSYFVKIEMYLAAEIVIF